jgi:hypothetical protein
MVRKLLVFFLFIAKIQFADAQIDWSFSFNSESNEIELRADLEEGWHLYSQYIENDLGPIPTSILFKTSDCFKLLGKTKEPESIKAYDPNFEGDLNFFSDKVTFSQKVKIEGACSIKGAVDFMICNDRMCLPPTVKEFIVSVQD